MKTTAIVAALGELERNHSGTDCQSEAKAEKVLALVLAAKDELASLSSVPEDVARDRETAHYATKVLPSSPHFAEAVEKGRAAIVRLATAAARVPGLESKLGQMTLRAQEAEQRCSVVTDAANEAQDKLEATESERDTLAARVPGLEAEVAELRKAVQYETSRRKSAERDAATAESERDAAREDVERVESERATHDAAATAAEKDRKDLRKQVEELEQRLSRETAWKESARLERDAARQEVDDWRRKALDRDLQVTTLTAERDALTVRVAELEREVAEMHGQCEAHDDRAREAEARAAAAEGREGTLRAALDVCVEYAARVPVGHHLEPLRNRAHSAALNALAANLPGARPAAWDGAFAAQPTTAPGLREAVGKVLEAYPEMPHLPREQATLFEQLGAAYDAAKGGEATATLEPLTEEQLERRRAMAKPVVERTAERIREREEKAAKWDAAVGLAKDEDAAACALLGIPSFRGSGMPPSHKASWRAKAQTFTRWLLGLDTPPSGPSPLDARCTCTHERGMHQSAAGKCMDAGCACERFTPPSGPGGGERKPEDTCGDCGQHVDEHRDGGKAESCEARNDLCEPSGPGGGGEDGTAASRPLCGEVTPCTNHEGHDGGHSWEEPTALTPESLAAVVEEYAREQEAASDVLWEEGDEVGAADDAGRAKGAREVLRRATGGEAPRVLSESRVRRALESAWSLASDKADGDTRDTLEQVGADIGIPIDNMSLTLPTGPGGREGPSPGVADVVKTYGHHASTTQPPPLATFNASSVPRARIAPTPDGPALERAADWTDRQSERAVAEARSWPAWKRTSSVLAPAAPEVPALVGCDEACPKREDGIHCEHWQDGALCCDCGAPADPETCQTCGAADGCVPTCDALPDGPTLAEPTVCPGCKADDYCSCPEVLPKPAAPKVVRGFHDDRTCGACDGPLETSRDAVCEKCAPESIAHYIAASMAPTAPEVVHEEDGVRVFGDGDVQTLRARIDGHVWVGIEDSSAVQGVHARALARALAEAKRESAAMRKAYAAVQHADTNCSWATAGGDVLAIHSSRLEKDTAEAARKAAEAMRERIVSHLVALLVPRWIVDAVRSMGVDE